MRTAAGLLFLIKRTCKQRRGRGDNNMAGSKEEARREFEAANNVQSVVSVDSIFKYNPQEQQELLAKKPWLKECVHYLIPIFLYVLTVGLPAPVFIISRRSGYQPWRYSRW